MVVRLMIASCHEPESSPFPAYGAYLELVPFIADEDVGTVPQECALGTWGIALKG